MNSSIRNTGDLYKFFREQTASLSSQPAVSTAETALSFADLFRLADSLAEQLAEAGIRDGDVVGLAVPNSLSFVPALLALFHRSATVALVSPKYRESELRAIEAGVQPRCFLTSVGLVKSITSSLPIEKSVAVTLPSLHEELALLFTTSSRPIANSTALIKFTSGSTGTPKGIAVTVDNVFAEAENVVRTLAITAKDVILAPVPIFHSYGFDLGVLSMLYAGAHLQIRENFIPRRLLADLAAPEISIFLGVPSMYHILVETLLPAVPDLSHVRYMLSCTAPLSSDLIMAFFHKFRMPICQHYGSSETGAATNHEPASVLAKADSVGKPMHNVAVQIMDDEGHPLPCGEVGEVVVSSGVVAPGYIMGDSTGQAKFNDGTYKTGDLGYMDAAGFLYLRGRKDDMINVGGLKVSPFEVVQVLQSHAGVREAAVAGVKDAMGEEVVYAVVTLKSPVAEQDLLSYCRVRLSEYKVPRRIDMVEEMPRGPSGKVKINAKDIKL